MSIRIPLPQYITLVPTQNITIILNKIRERINREDFTGLNKDVELGGVFKTLEDAQTKVDGIPAEKVFLKSSITLKELEVQWRNFEEHFDGNVTSEQVEKYRALLKATVDFLSTLEVEPIGPHPSNTRGKNEREEQNRLETLREKREEVKRALVLAQNENPRDEEKIQKLRSQLQELEGNYVQTKKTIDDLKTDSAEEEQIRKRIDEAFSFLGKDNHLENELKKLQIEYYVMLVLVTLTIVLFCVFYACFLIHLKSLKLEAWHDYLPYTMVVPITVGLLWLFVYLKNRASKLSLELSTKLYDLRYMEGLMKMTNSMSRSSAEAFSSIREMVRDLVKSFICKMADQSFKEQDLSAIEKRELEDSPYWKILEELKELIKLIRK